MADVKISQLNEVTDPYLFDVVPIVNNGETKKVSLENILKNTYQGSDVKALTGRYEAVSTIVQYNSANWDSTFNTVTALSSFWEESADIIPTVTNYLSTSNVLISSLFVSQQLEVSGVNTTVFYVNENKVGVNTKDPNQELTIIGNISATENIYGNIPDLTQIKSLTSNWESTYTEVQTNSGDWEKAYDIGTAYSLASSSFITFESDSQTLSYNEPTQELSIFNGNTVQLGSLASKNYVNSNFLPLSGGSVNGTVSLSGELFVNDVLFISGNNIGIGTLSANEVLTVIGNVSSTGNFYGNGEFLENTDDESVNTVVRTTSANWNEAYNIATEYQNVSGIFALDSFVNSNFLNLTGGTITEDLTVLKNLYVNGSAVYINASDLVVADPIIYIGEGNIADSLDLGLIVSWTRPVSAGGYTHGGFIRRADNKTWTLFSGISTEPLSSVNVDWDQEGIQLETLSANFAGDLVKDTIVYGNLSAQNNVYGANINYQNWDDAYTAITTFYNTLSYDGSDLKALTGKFEDVSNLVQDTSAQWNESYDVSTVFVNISSRYDSSSTVVENTSGNWNISYNVSTAYQDISSSFVDVRTAVNNTSGNWDDVYTTFKSGSANYILDGGNTKNANLSLGSNDNFNVAIKTNNIPRVTILNSGNVGIGTSNPISKLNLVEDNVNAFRISNNEQHEYYASFGCNLSAGYFTAGSALVRDVPLIFRTALAGAETERVIFSSEGKVGIGTLSPNEFLTVIGNISASGNVYANNLNVDEWNQAYDISTAYSLASSTFLTSETDSQTLSYNENDQSLTISNGNVVSLSALNYLGNDVRALTSNWQDTYTTVQTYSSSWEESLDIVPTITNYLSTNNVTVSSLRVIDSDVIIGLEQATTVYIESGKLGVNTEIPNKELTVIGDISATGSLFGDGSQLTGITGDDINVSTLVRTNSGQWDQAYDISTAYSLASSTFLTSETDSQTLSYDESNQLLSISNANIVSLSALNYLGNDVRALTSKFEDVSNLVQSSSSDWNYSFDVATAYQNVSSSYATINFVDSNFLPLSGGVIQGGIEIGGGLSTTFYVGSGLVGINTEFPNQELTVVGDISATGSLFGDGSQLTGIVAGDTEATTLVRTNSASWNYQGTDIKALTANWESSYLTVKTLSASWEESSEILPTVTNYLSTSNVLISSATINTTLSARGTIYTDNKQVVTTNTTTIPGVSAITKILAVSALPTPQEVGTLYILF